MQLSRKEEDCPNLVEDSCLVNESLFLRHLDTRWLTLVSALEQIKNCWEGVRTYFLVHVASKKEYMKILPENKKLQIAEPLKDDTKLLL